MRLKSLGDFKVASNLEQFLMKEYNFAVFYHENGSNSGIKIAS